MLDRLDEIFRAHGAHVTRQRSIRIAGSDWLDRVTAAMAALRSRPARRGRRPGRRSTSRTCCPAARLPPSDVLIWTLDGARLVVRPSGTEPKLKSYAEAVVRSCRTATMWATARAEASAVVDEVLAAATRSSPLTASDRERWHAAVALTRSRCSGRAEEAVAGVAEARDDVGAGR